MYLTQHQTPRLLIRPLTFEDAAAWSSFFISNESLRFFNLPANQTPLELSNYWLNFQLKRYAENRYGLLALTEKETGNLVGMCGLLTQEVNGQNELEIGYHLLPPYWGKGFASEAAQHFKAFAWLHNLSHSLVSIIHEENLSSQKVAAKNGMVRGEKTEFQGQPVYIYRIFKTQTN